MMEGGVGFKKEAKYEREGKRWLIVTEQQVGSAR